MGQGGQGWKAGCSRACGESRERKTQPATCFPQPLLCYPTHNQPASLRPGSTWPRGMLRIGKDSSPTAMRLLPQVLGSQERLSRA